MQITGNAKQLGIAFGINILLICTCLIGIIASIHWKKTGIEVNAVVVDSSKEFERFDSDNKNWYTIYKYSYKGNSYMQKVLSLYKKKEGKTVKLYINPNNPEVVYKTMYTPLYVGVICMCFILCIAIIRTFKSI